MWERATSVRIKNTYDLTFIYIHLFTQEISSLAWIEVLIVTFSYENFINP